LQAGICRYLSAGGGIKNTNHTWYFLLSMGKEEIIEVKTANIFEGMTRGTTAQSK